MSRPPRCLITGCELVAINTGAKAHGDLHQVGNAYVFNAVLDEHGETKWTRGGTPTRSNWVALHTGDVFERRGVLVFALGDAALSEAARNYIEGAP